MGGCEWKAEGIGGYTNLSKSSEKWIILHFLVNSIGRYGIIWNILHIGFSEIQCGVEDRSSNAAYYWVLFELDVVESVDQSAVMGVQLSKIMENILDETVKFIWRYNWWIGISKRLNIHLQWIGLDCLPSKRKKAHTASMFSRSLTYIISPLISSKMTLSGKVNQLLMT